MALYQKTPNNKGNRPKQGQGSYNKEGNQENRRPYDKNKKSSFSRGYQSTIYHKTQVDIQPRAKGTTAEGSKRFGPSNQEEGSVFAASPERNQGFNKRREGNFKGKSPQGKDFQNKRPSYQGRDGEQKPYQNKFQGKSRPSTDGEQRPYQNRFQGKTHPSTDGEQRPYQNKPFRKTNNDFQKRSYDQRPEPIKESPRKPSYQDFQYQKPTNKSAFEQETPEDSNEDIQSIVLAGRNPIREALKSGRDLEKLLVQKGELSGSAKEIVMLAKNAQVPVQIVEKIRLDTIAPHHQGLIAYGSAFAYSSLEEILALAEEKNEAPFLVLLDGITDPHNLGAIIRSAEWSGAHGVIVPQRRSVGLTPAAVKASAGAVEYIKVARVTNLVRTIEELQSKNIWVFGADSQGKNYREVDFRGACALVIGAEGEGISQLVKSKCDQTVSLPVVGKIDSLNASVATGVLLYRILETR